VLCGSGSGKRYVNSEDLCLQAVPNVIAVGELIFTREDSGNLITLHEHQNPMRISSRALLPFCFLCIFLIASNKGPKQRYVDIGLRSMRQFETGTYWIMKDSKNEPGSIGFQTRSQNGKVIKKKSFFAPQTGIGEEIIPVNRIV